MSAHSTLSLRDLPRVRQLHSLPAAGFTLIELLVVIGIIIIVLSMAMTGFQRSSDGSLDKALMGVASGLELARQTAIAQSTYTWVFLAEDDLGVDGNVITMVMVASKDGSLTPNMTADKFRLMNKVEQFPGVKFGDASDVQDLKENLPVRSNASMQDPAVSGPRMPPSTLLPDWARDRKFADGKVVMFSPNGEAALDRNESSAAEIPIYEALQMVIVPAKGPSPSEIEKKSSSIVLVNGVTGLSTVHQPM